MSKNNNKLDPTETNATPSEVTRRLSVSAETIAEPPVQFRASRANPRTNAVIIQDGDKWVVPKHGGDVEFDSIAEARKYCADNHLRIIQEQYS